MVLLHVNVIVCDYGNFYLRKLDGFWHFSIKRNIYFSSKILLEIKTNFYNYSSTLDVIIALYLIEVPRDQCLYPYQRTNPLLKICLVFSPLIGVVETKEIYEYFPHDTTETMGLRWLPIFHVPLSLKTSPFLTTIMHLFYHKIELKNFSQKVADFDGQSPHSQH